MSAEIITLRKPKKISVYFNEDGWHVVMPPVHKVFWKRHLASGFIDWLLARHIAVVEIVGEIPDE